MLVRALVPGSAPLLGTWALPVPPFHDYSIAHSSSMIAHEQRIAVQYGDTRISRVTRITYKKHYFV